MKKVMLEAKKRTEEGKIYSKKIRAKGYVPAVIYGKGFDSLKIEVPDKVFRQGLSSSGANAVFDINVEGTSVMAMASEIQRHPVAKSIFHIDFHKVNLDQKVSATVAITLEGDAQGVKAGGNLVQIARSVVIETLPMSIPEHITIDVSNLGIGEEIRVKDIKVADGIEILSDPDELVVSINAIKEESEEGQEDIFASASTQPEVIKKGKDEE